MARVDSLTSAIIGMPQSRRKLLHSKPIAPTASPQRSRSRRSVLARLALGLLVTSQGGCGLLGKIPPGKHDTVASYHDDTGLQIEYPEVATCATTPQTISAEQAIAPLVLEDPSTIPTFDMTLEEAIQMAVEQSPVLRRIGGTVVTSPQSTPTIFDPALVSCKSHAGHGSGAG